MERIRDLIDEGNDSDCWEWQGNTNNGYGRTSIDNQDTYIHRYIYSQEIKDPGDKYVCHHCDNPLCVNPNHLFLGTQEDNMSDAKEKERQAKGENLPQSKISAEDVPEIRRRAENETHRELGKEFGVSHTTIGNIYREKTWTHLND